MARRGKRGRGRGNKWELLNNATDGGINQPIAVVFFPQGNISLAATERGLRWTTDSSNEEVKSKASWANFRSAAPSYEYSPADGPVGRALAAMVARELGGALSLTQGIEAHEEVIPETGLAYTEVENMSAEEFYAAIDRERAVNER